MDKVYTVHDIHIAECNLEPIICLHCGQIGEVIYDQYIGDGYCQVCGKWQLENK